MTANLQISGTGHSGYPGNLTDRAYALSVTEDKLLMHFEHLGSSRRVARNAPVFVEGEKSNCWFTVVSGTVRLFKILSDGRRHIVDFYFPGECFGMDRLARRVFSAEAVTDVTLIRFSKSATEAIIDESPDLARRVREKLLNDIATVQLRNLQLGQLKAPERVAAFLLDVCGRCHLSQAVELSMPRIDIADYLGLTIETVCRVLTTLKRKGTIAAPNPHQIELRDRPTLTLLAEA